MNDLTITTNDGFAVQENTGTTMIRGKMLKFTDGKFVCDKIEILPADSELVAVGTITAWVHWENGIPDEHRITQAGPSHPDRDELPDLDSAKWPPGLDSKPSDPWRDTRYLYLIDPNTGENFTFVTDSFGGRRAVGDLKQQIANVRSAHPDALAVVQLASTTMKTKFGPKPRPHFKVVSWRGKRDDSSANSGNSAKRADMNDDVPF